MSSNVKVPNMINEVHLVERYAVYTDGLIPTFRLQNPNIITAEIGGLMVNIYHQEERWMFTEIFSELSVYERDIFQNLRIDRPRIESYLAENCKGFRRGAIFFENELDPNRSMEKVPLCSHSATGEDTVSDFLCIADGGGQFEPCILGGFDCYKDCPRIKTTGKKILIRSREPRRIFLQSKKGQKQKPIST